jgi:hypothetical protein
MRRLQVEFVVTNIRLSLVFIVAIRMRTVSQHKKENTAERKDICRTRLK